MNKRGGRLIFLKINLPPFFSKWKGLASVFGFVGQFEGVEGDSFQE